MRRVGPYELIAELGSGGLGQVWRARHATGHEVALKLLLRDARDLSGLERERFVREGLALLRVRDPGLVALVDHGLQESLPWLAMELVPGETLAARLRAGPFAPVRALELALELGRTLQRLHAAGVIHRDLKPQNVMLRPTPEGERPVLLDLGLAHLVDLRTRLTRTGELVGTPGYMSPEQANGEPIGPSADVYGLGAVLYALLCGGPPFQGTPMEVVSGLLTRDPPPPSRRRPGLARELDELVLRCLRKSPPERPELGYLCQELDRLRRLPAGEAPRRASSRRPLVVAAGLVALGAAAGGALELARSGRRADPSPAAVSATASPAPSLPADERARLARRRSLDLVEQARRAREAGDPPRAVALLEEAVSADPEHAYAWYALGLAVSLEGQPGRLRALELLERSLALDPTNAKAWHQRALTLFDLGRKQEALQTIDRALEIDPGQARTWSVRAIFCLKQGDQARARADVARAVELAPDDPGVLSDQGWILRYTGDPDGALRAWEASLAREPDRTSTLEHRARLLVELGRAREAEADYDHLLRLEPASALRWHDRAVLRWSLRDVGGAREDYGRALELDPTLASAWWGHAKTAVLLNDYRSAAEDYQRYLHLAPDGPGAAEARDFLTQLQDAARRGG